LHGAFHPAPSRIPERRRLFAEILPFALRAYAGARSLSVIGLAHDCAPGAAARERRGGSGHTVRSSARVAGKRPARLLRQSSPAAVCAAPENRRCASAARIVLRKRPRPCEEAAASASRLATLRRRLLVRRPPETRLRFFVSC